MSLRPDLSIILAGKTLTETRFVRSLFRVQTIAERLELILILPEALSEDLERELFDGLWGGQVLTMKFASRGEANAAGVRAASARVVVLAEDHCYPEADWAEALLADHAGPWAVVGPRVRNANPRSRVSQADYLIGYGPWSMNVAAGEVPFLPGHNSSYKRDVLLACGEDLGLMMTGETVLHWRLRKQGYRLLLSEHAIVRHLNFSIGSVFARAQLLNGRQFAAVRASEWGRSRRLIFGLAAPLIPWVRAWRLCRFLGGKGADATPWGVLPTLLVGLHVDAAGQALGYLAGAGCAVEQLADYEFERTDFVRKDDHVRIETLAGGAA